MRLHVLQHVSFERPGSIGDWARDRGHDVTVTRLWEGDPLPTAGGFDRLVVMGGPMSVHDEPRLPWLAEEKRFLRGALERGARVLGICLGAQLLAEALGGRVVPARAKEIGWFPVALTPAAAAVPAFAGLPERWEVFHWHGETFDLPPGAVRLAGTEACPNQAFAHGRNVLALQFHPEATRHTVEALVEHAGHEIVDGPHIQSAPEMLGDEPRFAKARERMRVIMDALAAGDAASRT
jgi:GMP synthase (glutamine-hydrolysing)